LLPSRVPSRTLLTPPEPITAPRPDEQAAAPPPALVSGRYQRVPRWTLAGIFRQPSNPNRSCEHRVGALDAALRSATSLPLGREATGRAARHSLAAVPPPPGSAGPFGLPNTAQRMVVRPPNRTPPRRPPCRRARHRRLLASPMTSRRSVNGFCSNTAKLSRATGDLHQRAATMQVIFEALFVFSVNRSVNTAHIVHRFPTMLSTDGIGPSPRGRSHATARGRRGER